MKTSVLLVTALLLTNLALARGRGRPPVQGSMDTNDAHQKVYGLKISLVSLGAGVDQRALETIPAIIKAGKQSIKRYKENSVVGVEGETDYCIEYTNEKARDISVGLIAKEEFRHVKMEEIKDCSRF